MRTIFVGDVHGCARQLAELLKAVDYRPGEDRLLLTGDAFSRGPQPLEVWRLIQDQGADMVLGNHDARLLKQLQRLARGKDPKYRRPEQRQTVEALLPAATRLLPWLELRPLLIETGEYILVHAGVHPRRGPAGTSRDEFLEIRFWPPDGTPDQQRWHDCYTQTDRLLVFGHDALGGLVHKRRSDGTTYLMGLDSGCVYGNQLSAYILEEDALVQVENDAEAIF